MQNKSILCWFVELIDKIVKIYLSNASVCNDTIYQYISYPQTKNCKELIDYLRHAYRKMQEKIRKCEKTKFRNKLFITVRPKSIETFFKFVYWECNRLVFRKDNCFRQPERRKSRIILIMKLLGTSCLFVPRHPHMSVIWRKM